MALELTFKALSDVNRREILRLLRQGSLNAGELAEHFEMTPATLSYHLALLKKAGLIVEKREKNFRQYSLNTSVFEEVLSYIYSFQSKKEED
jgi:transcription regulator, arsR family